MLGSNAYDIKDNHDSSSCWGIHIIEEQSVEEEDLILKESKADYWNLEFEDFNTCSNKKANVNNSQVFTGEHFSFNKEVKDNNEDDEVEDIRGSLQKITSQSRQE